MDGFEEHRRDFLKELGLITEAEALSDSGLPDVPELLAVDKVNFSLTVEQQKFMVRYENWLEEFRSMAQIQKHAPDDVENNRKLMALSEEAGTWQKELVGYMKDGNFSRYFMTLSERVTAAI